MTEHGRSITCLCGITQALTFHRDLSISDWEKVEADLKVRDGTRCPISADQSFWHKNCTRGRQKWGGST